MTIERVPESIDLNSKIVFMRPATADTADSISSQQLLAWENQIKSDIDAGKLFQQNGVFIFSEIINSPVQPIEYWEETDGYKRRTYPVLNSTIVLNKFNEIVRSYGFDKDTVQKSRTTAQSELFSEIVLQSDYDPNLILIGECDYFDGINSDKMHRILWNFKREAEILEFPTK